LALDSLSKIYLSSIQDLHDRLDDLSKAEVNFDINPPPSLSDSDAEQKKVEHIFGSATIPFFMIEGSYNPRGIRANKTYEDKIDHFTPNSDWREFNPTAHMLIEPEKQESDDEMLDFDEPEEDENYNKVQIIRVRDLNQEQLSY
jgi:hypothetical protein